MGSSSAGVGKLLKSCSLSTLFQRIMKTMVMRPMYCPTVAAVAAPTTPQPATNTKNRSRLRLTALAAALAISGVLHHMPADGLACMHEEIAAMQGLAVIQYIQQSEQSFLNFWSKQSWS